jgi:hypothetical protein
LETPFPATASPSTGAAIRRQHVPRGSFDMPVIDLWDVPDRKPRQPRKSLRGLDITATWSDLLTAEPRLQDFMDEILGIPGTSWETCPDAVWYGWQVNDSRRGIKARLRKFVGGELPVFFAAYRALYASMPICRHCLERDDG